jgi:hypothetical protein
VNEAGVEHQLKSTLNWVRIGIYTTSDLARMQLLAGRRNEQGEDLARDAPSGQKVHRHSRRLPPLWFD